MHDTIRRYIERKRKEKKLVAILQSELIQQQLVANIAMDELLSHPLDGDEFISYTKKLDMAEIVIKMNNKLIDLSKKMDYTDAIANDIFMNVNSFYIAITKSLMMNSLAIASMNKFQDFRVKEMLDIKLTKFEGFKDEDKV